MEDMRRVSFGFGLGQFRWFFILCASTVLLLSLSAAPAHAADPPSCTVMTPLFPQLEARSGTQAQITYTIFDSTSSTFFYESTYSSYPITYPSQTISPASGQNITVTTPVLVNNTNSDIWAYFSVQMSGPGGQSTSCLKAIIVNPAETVTLTSSDNILTEGQSSADNGVFTLNRTGPGTNDLTVGLLTSSLNLSLSGTGSGGQCFVGATKYEPVMPAGSTSCTVIVLPRTNDLIYQGDKEVVNRVAALGYPYERGIPNEVTFTVRDDDLNTSLSSSAGTTMTVGQQTTLTATFVASPSNTLTTTGIADNNSQYLSGGSGATSPRTYTWTPTAAGTYLFYAGRASTPNPLATNNSSVTIVVNNVSPPSCSLTPSPTSSWSGQSVALGYTITNTAETASIVCSTAGVSGVGCTNPNFVSPSASGSTTVAPTNSSSANASVSYTMTVSNGGGSSTCQGNVVVKPALICPAGVVSSGSNFTITANGGNHPNSDSVYLYTPGAANSSYLAYQNIPTATRPVNLTFNLTPAGNYEARLFSAGTYNQIGSSCYFSVAAPNTITIR